LLKVDLLKVRPTALSTKQSISVVISGICNLQQQKNKKKTKKLFSLFYTKPTVLEYNDLTHENKNGELTY